jgi:hypothetical protein
MSQPALVATTWLPACVVFAAERASIRRVAAVLMFSPFRESRLGSQTSRIGLSLDKTFTPSALPPTT